MLLMFVSAVEGNVSLHKMLLYSFTKEVVQDLCKLIVLGTCAFSESLT